MADAIRMWSAVCSEAPHSQFGEEARPHLCIDKWNRPTPVRGRLSLTQAVCGKLITTDLALVIAIKIRSLDVFLQYSTFCLQFVHSEAQMPSPATLFNRFRAAGTNRRLDLSLSWRASDNPLKKLKHGQINKYDAGFLLALKEFSVFWVNKAT